MKSETSADSLSDKLSPSTFLEIPSTLTDSDLYYSSGSPKSGITDFEELARSTKMSYKKHSDESREVSPSKIVTLMELGLSKIDSKGTTSNSGNQSTATNESGEGLLASSTFCDTSRNGNQSSRDGHSDSSSNKATLAAKLVAIMALLYCFVCSLDLLSGSFRLIAGKAAGEVFHQQKMLNNPIVGVMIGILVTVAVQSSSTSTSIVVSMVSSGLFTVRTAIPIVMGANIGTSVTNTIVALTHMSSREDFERAFAGSVLHDMFNLLAVGTMLVLEEMTGYLEKSTTAIVDSIDLTSSRGADVQVLSHITKPFTSLIVQLDKNVIIGWSTGESKYENASLLREWCNKSIIVQNESSMSNLEVPAKCHYLFNMVPMSDTTAGLILLGVSLFALCGCLICLVKVLSTLLKGKLADAVQRGVNANIPFCPFMTGYLAILIGAVMTILVQSSSVFTSAMTPLIAMNMISLERAYPLTLGSNLGTTTTAMLAALAAEGPNLRLSIQLAFCHFIFNLTGIMMFYPIPFTRFPIRMARFLGRVTAQYRWFAIFYLIFMFVILPLLVFGLSLIGPAAFYVVIGILGILFVSWTILSAMQVHAPHLLPDKFRTMAFLPIYVRSLEPYDSMVQKLLEFLRHSCCYFCFSSASTERQEIIRIRPNRSSSIGLDNYAFNHMNPNRLHSTTPSNSSSESPLRHPGDDADNYRSYKYNKALKSHP